MFITSFIATCFLLTACGNNQSSNDIKPETKSDAADIIFKNGDIYTVNPAHPWASAIAINDGIITYVGELEDATKLADDNTRFIDLAGRMMLPGLHDVHIHPLESASEATHFVVDGENTIRHYQNALLDASAQYPNTPWLIGYGHNIDTLLAMQTSPIEVLDQVVSDRPVIIMEQTSHSMWVNSKALALANISSQTVDPIGGVIGRDDNQTLNGILYDNAGNIVMDLAMQHMGTESQQNYDGFVDYTQPKLLRHGITSISDARVYWQRGQLDTWQQLAKDDVLKLRVSLGLWAYPQASDEYQISQLISLYQNKAESLLKVNQIKFYMDGILVNTTAAMKQPYEFGWLDLENNRGLNYFTQSRLTKYIKALEPIGFDFNIHAIGDRGVHEALSAIESSTQGNARHRLTHIEVVDPKDYHRFKALNVIADAQVAGDFTNPDHWPEMIPLLGHHRADHLVPIKSLVDQGAKLTLSSDWNVSTLNPFIGIANAISRQPEAITLEQAIASYTINSSYAMRQENIVGSIEVGKEADFIILENNLFDLTPHQIKQVQVNQTWVKGQRVF